MIEYALVPEFLKKFARERGFETHDCLYGSISLGCSFPVKQSNGSVYGIWVNSSVPPRANFSSLPGHEDWYAVYWGRDIAPVSRLKAHVQGHKNGNAHLPDREELRGRPLIFGAVIVSRYRQFEGMLHSRFPPLYGSSSEGRRTTVVQVLGDIS